MTTRAARITFSAPQQKEGGTSISLSRAVVIHSLRRRKRKDPVFPLTGGRYQAMARELGHHVGEHKALREIRKLVEEGFLIPAGSYRQKYSNSIPSGWRVRLYRLRPPDKQEASIRRPVVVKRKWWAHPLFGNPDSRPTRDLDRRLRRWKEPGWEW